MKILEILVSLGIISKQAQLQPDVSSCNCKMCYSKRPQAATSWVRRALVTLPGVNNNKRKTFFILILSVRV